MRSKKSTPKNISFIFAFAYLFRARKGVGIELKYKLIIKEEKRNGNWSMAGEGDACYF